MTNLNTRVKNKEVVFVYLKARWQQLLGNCEARHENHECKVGGENFCGDSDRVLLQHTIHQFTTHQYSTSISFSPAVYMGQKLVLNLNDTRQTTSKTGRVGGSISSSIFSVTERSVLQKHIIIYSRQNTE